LINCEIIKFAGHISFSKDAIPAIENISFQETLEMMLDYAARSVGYALNMFTNNHLERSRMPTPHWTLFRLWNSIRQISA
jgi:hypothetical protein